MWVLDTNAVSDIMQHDPKTWKRLEEIQPAEVILCSPVGAEIRYGLARLPEGSRRRQLLELEYRQIRDAANWVDWNEAAADRFGAIKATLERAGAIIEDFDIAIAAVALELRAGVATRNVRHFERIPGLEVEDWSR